MLSAEQLEMVRLSDLVPKQHVYRAYARMWSFEFAEHELGALETDNDHKGYGMLRLFKCLVLQFVEDLSDRQLERFLQENTAGRWFCGFALQEKTPSYTVFSRARDRIGPSVLSKLFQHLKKQLQLHGYMNQVFQFVDSTHLISKATLWKERDKASEKKLEKLNNEVLPQVAHDKQARIGCKGNGNYWYGYKQHTSVDMQSGLIDKVAITPANLTDSQGFKHVCPSQGAVYADKGYCTRPAQTEANRHQVHLAAVKKRNMPQKNRDQDRWFSRIRAPFEGVFSKMNKRVRYVGIAKNQFAAFMHAFAFNLKRLAVIAPPQLALK